MDAGKKYTPPVPLERLRQRFDRWRSTHRVRSRLPEPLWRSAVRMAGRYGLNRTAKTLRLDYYVLKEHIEQDRVAIADVPKKESAAFVELTSSPFVGICDCTLDFENAGGAKMRVQLKSSAMPDLAALSRSFWDQQR
jgi:hypothetical protein